VGISRSSSGDIKAKWWGYQGQGEGLRGQGQKKVVGGACPLQLPLLMTVPGGQETKWRKALEWALRVSEIKLQLFVGEETKENKGGTRGALVIKARDEQSATAVLQLIRSSINPQEVGVKVKGLAKKEKGEIKVEVQETKRGGRMAFKKAAEVHAEGKAQISWYEPKRTLMLRDVDNVITEEEIRKSISMEAGTDTGDKRCVLKSPNREMRAGGHMQW
jgi:hypothetical protein